MYFVSTGRMNAACTYGRQVVRTWSSVSTAVAMVTELRSTDLAECSHTPSIRLTDEFTSTTTRRGPTEPVKVYKRLSSIAIITRSPAIAEGPRDAGVPVEIW